MENLSTEDISGWIAGSYAAKVTDFCSWNTAMTFTVKNLTFTSIKPCDTTNIIINGTVQDANSNESDGSITLDIWGYHQYEWKISRNE